MIVYGTLPIMYQQAIKLLAYALQQDFKAQIRIGMELEHRLRHDNHKMMGYEDIHRFQRKLREKIVMDRPVFRRFYAESETDKYEVTTQPLPPGMSSEALREYTENALEWVQKLDGRVKEFGLEPVYHAGAERCTQSQHANIDVVVNGKPIFRHAIPAPMNAMMQETLRQNILLLIESPETFVTQHWGKAIKHFTIGDDKSTGATLCERTGGEHGRYLEIRCADSKAAPEALEMLALLGTYLGLAHPEAQKTDRDVRMPTSIKTSAHWFEQGRLLKDTLDALSARYGERLAIPKGLGSMMHREVVQQHMQHLPTFADALTMANPSAASYRVKDGLPGMK